MKRGTGKFSGIVFALALFLVCPSFPQAHASSPFSGPAAAGRDLVTGDVGDDEDDYGYDEDDEDDEDDGEWDGEEWDDEELTPEEQEAVERASDVGHWGDPVESSTREWTVLVYLDGDNNLEGQAIWDMVEMQLGMASIDPDLVDVIVLFDRSNEFVDWDGDWDETRVYRILPSENDEDIESEVLHNCGELNMGSGQTLENFIAEGMRVFPAPRTALFLWNHGGGWADLLNDDDAPGSEDGTDSMDLEEARVALSRAAVHYPDGKLDLLVLDMCLMGQAEVLVAVAPYAKFLVASPPLAPGLGMNYEGMLSYFADGLETSKVAVGVARTACQAFLDVDWKDASLAVYDLSKVGGLLSSFGALARKFDTLVPVAWSHLTRSIFYTRNFGGREDLYQRSGSTSSIDILDWLSRLQAISDPMLAREFAPEIEAVRKALADIIVYQESGPLMPGSNGLAVYAPLRADNYNDDYESNAFGAYTDWAQALRDLYREQKDNAGSPPRIAAIEFGSLAMKRRSQGKSRSISFAMVIEPSDVVLVGGDDGEDPDTDDNYVKLMVNGTNIMWVNAGFAVSGGNDPDGPYLPVMLKTILNSQIIAPSDSAKASAADDEIPIFRDGRNELIYRLSPYITGLSNGTDMTLVYPQHLDASRPDEARIYGQILRAGEKDWSMAIVNTSNREIVSVTTWTEDEDGNSPVTSIIPAPEDRFRPIHRYYDADGDEEFEAGEEIVWGQSPSLVRSWPPEGRYIKIICMAESLAGEGSLRFGEPLEVRERLEEGNGDDDLGDDEEYGDEEDGDEEGE